MSQIGYQLISASNFSEQSVNFFHKNSNSIVSWESSQFAVTPIDVLFKLLSPTFVTQIYMHPKKNKYANSLEIMVSDNNKQYNLIAKVHDFTDTVRIQISAHCNYVKIRIASKDQGRPASIDILRIYGHPFLKLKNQDILTSQRHDKVQQTLIQLGYNRHEDWDVDEQTLKTVVDMTRIQQQLTVLGNKEKIIKMKKDLKIVIQYGKRIKYLQNQKKYLSAKTEFQKIKDVQDQIYQLRQKIFIYDQLYQTSKYQQSLAMNDNNQLHDQQLRKMLQQDRIELQKQRQLLRLQAQRQKQQLQQQFENQQGTQQWWQQQNQLDQIEQEPAPPKIQKPKKKEPQGPDQYKFKNPYVYNQGDADMQKYIKPLLNQMGADYIGDPQLLRKYEQMEYLDVLGARIWMSAHSQNWRQRAAAVQAVLNFSMDKLPERYNSGRTKNLFLALMQFSRVNAEDKVLQIYYTSLKIMAVALQPPICGQDVPPVIINKAVQKFMTILVQKISQMNARAKQISLKQLITIFKHPAVDISIGINQCLRLCKPQLNIKFVPVDKQNPRLIMSRLQIIGKLLEQFKMQKRKVDLMEILSLLVQGSLFHTNSQVRTLAIKIAESIYKVNPQGTVNWLKNVQGLKQNIVNQLQQKFSIA